MKGVNTMGRATIKYQYGSYSGTVDVIAKDTDDNDILYAKAKKKADLNFLAMAYESYKVIWREYDCE